MNDLKTLFEDALAGEPTQVVPVAERVARGRARRARMLRLRAGGAAVVTAAVAAGLLLPSSPISVVDAEVAQAPRTGGTRADAVVSPEVAGDPLKLSMWQAVDDVLPSDVQLVENAYVDASGPGPNLYLSLERGDVQFSLSIWMQNSRPDLPDFRPCTEPVLPLVASSSWANCEQGADDEGRWRAIGDDGMDTLLVLDGAPAAVTLRWGVHYEAGQVDDDGVPFEPETALTAVEADRIADAVWSVGSQHTRADLVSGVDLEATAHTSWPDIEAALEESLGPLTVLTPVDGDITRAVDDVQVQTGLLSAAYATADGTRVDIVVGQRARVYQPMCVEQFAECVSFPGAMTSVGAGDPPAGNGSGGTLGDRGFLMVRADAASPQLEDAVSSATIAAIQVVPFLGGER